MTDRAGAGLVAPLASDLGGLPDRRALILDPRTGTLLGSEELLTETAGALNVEIPAVIDYTAYVESRWSQGLT